MLKNWLLACLCSAVLFAFGPADGLGQEPAAGAGEKSAVTAPATSDQKADDHHAGEDDHDHDHGHAGHDSDPVTANMTDVASDPSELRKDMAVASLIVFGCLLLGLTAVAWKPIAAGLHKREQMIADNIAGAEKASQDAIAKLKEYEAKLGSANAEAQQILSDARKDAELAGQRLVATAQEEAARQRERAVAEIESAKSVALNELAQKSTDVAMTLAGRIIGREVKASDHQSMIQELLAKLPSKN